MANDFSNLASLEALYNFESGALHTDSSGNGNTLSVPSGEGDVTAEVGDYKQGSACADFEYGSASCLEIAAASMSADFPGKEGTSNYTWTACFWIKIESLTTQWGLFSCMSSAATDGFSVVIPHTLGANQLSIISGYGADFEQVYSGSGNVFSTATWYHAAVAVNGSTKAWKMRVWDDTAGAIAFTASGTFSNTPYILPASGPAFLLGGMYDGSGSKYDGFMDEFVLSSEYLDDSDIDLIRTGTYGVVGPDISDSIGVTDLGPFVIISDGVSGYLYVADYVSVGDYSSIEVEEANDRSVDVNDTVMVSESAVPAIESFWSSNWLYGINSPVWTLSAGMYGGNVLVEDAPAFSLSAYMAARQDDGYSPTAELAGEASQEFEDYFTLDRRAPVPEVVGYTAARVDNSIAPVAELVAESYYNTLTLEGYFPTSSVVAEILNSTYMTLDKVAPFPYLEATSIAVVTAYMEGTASIWLLEGSIIEVVSGSMNGIAPIWEVDYEDALLYGNWIYLDSYAPVGTMSEEGGSPASISENDTFEDYVLEYSRW